MYNSLPNTRQGVIKIRVSAATIQVLDTARGGEALAAQINPVVVDNDANLSDENYEVTVTIRLCFISWNIRICICFLVFIYSTVSARVHAKPPAFICA